MTEGATEEETTEAATTEEATEEETTEAESESETEVQFEYQDLPEYTAADYVTLGEYKGITVEQEPIEVSEEQIQAVIDTETVETLTEGTVEEGDTVNIDYEGTIDGETFDEGSAEGALLEIGSGTLIDGFESGLVGVAAGEEVDLNLTFPETYHSEDLAGKDVVFHVKVNSIQRVPELTDEVAAEVSDGMTAEEYRAKVREELAESAAEEQKAQSQSELLTKIFDDAIVDGYPVEVLDYMMERQVAGAEQQVQAYGMTLEEYLEAVGMTEDDFMAQSEEVCRQTLTQWMIVQAIAEEEDLMATDEEYEEELKTAAEQTGMEEAEIVEAYGENNIRTSVTQGKVLEFLMENANFVEKTEETETETETETAKETETEDAKEAETTEEAAEETAEETDAEETETETEMESETAGETETTEAE
ncbi:MAG: trigger factor, partial [Eubacteriales bacterium]|nr:trigger factor [Eubacteriales bacterium]